MKKWIISIAAVIILSGGAFYVYMRYSGNDFGLLPEKKAAEKKCKTVKYKLGSIANTDLTKKEAKARLKSAEKIWEQRLGKNIFEYNQRAKLTINISNTTSEKTLSLIEKQKKYNNLQEQREKLTEKYNKESDNYNKQVEQHQQEAKEYRQRARKLNEQGNVPEKKFEQLSQRKKEIEQKKNKLDEKKQELKQLAEKINSTSKKTKELTSLLDQGVAYSEIYSAEKFDPSGFSKGEINIEQFYGPKDLTLRFAHFLGHSYGMEHASNDSAAIMSPKLNKQNLTKLLLSPEDIKAFRLVCQK
jgi:myosin heavy subunit